MQLEAILADEERKRQFVLANVMLHRAQQLNWYDANFLIQFEAAKMLLGYTNPGRIEEFVAAFEPLRTDPGFTTRFEKGFLSQSRQAELVAAIAAIASSQIELHETGLFGRTVVHNLPQFDPVHRELATWVSEAAGEEVVPSYSFLSLYTHDGALPAHLDEPASKWTLDLCIEQNVEWPIHFSRVIDWPTLSDAETPRPGDPDLAFETFTLTPGDAVLFSGSSQWHCRDAMPDARAGFCNLLFLHYHPVGMESLAYPGRWAEHFDLPELAVLHCAYRRHFKPA